MRTQSKFVTVVTYVVLAGGLLFLIVTGASNLLKSNPVPLDDAKPGDLCELSADWAELAYEMTHYAEIIPIGKDKYYIMFLGEDVLPLLVRAKPSWVEKRFGSDGYSLGGEVSIRGTFVGLDYKFVKEIDSLNAEMGGDFLNKYYYIDIRYKEFGLLRLVAALGLIVFGAAYLLGKRGGFFEGNRLLKGIFAAAFFAFLMFSLYALGVGGSGV